MFNGDLLPPNRWPFYMRHAFLAIPIIVGDASLLLPVQSRANGQLRIRSVPSTVAVLKVELSRYSRRLVGLIGSS